MENFLWMLVGAMISAWTGIATSRYFMFRSEIFKASEQATKLPDTFSRMHALENEAAAEAECSDFLLAVILSLRSQGHWRASSKLAKRAIVSKELLTVCWKELKEGKQLLAIKAVQSGSVDLASMVILVNGGADKVHIGMAEAMKTIESLEPDWLTIFLGLKSSFKLARCYFWARHWYMTITVHMETGQPLEEIRTMLLKRAKSEQNAKHAA